MNPAELERFRFQPWTQTPDEVGYLENLEEDAIIPGMCRLRDGSDLRISNSLDDLLGIRGNNSEFSGSLGVNEIKLGITFDIDNVLLHQRVKSCRLSEINNIMFSVFNNSNCAQKLVYWKKAKMTNSRGYKFFKSLLINILEKGGVTFIEHGFLLIITADAPNRRKLCTLRSNVLYFSLLKTADLERRVKRRLEQQRSRSATESMSMLVSHEGEKVWGEKRIGNKVDMVAQIVGFKHRMNNGRDQICMQRYLTRVSKSGLDMPTMLNLEQFLPVDAPLLDYLVHDTRRLEGLKYPKLEDLESGDQSNRGLSLGMLKEIEVRELVCGVSSEEEIVATREWISRMHEMDQSLYGSQVISLDVEDVKVTYYDTLRMAGKLNINPEGAVNRTNLEKETIHGQAKDIWKQVPWKIMFGNGISWTCLISLDLKMTEEGDYVLEKMAVQKRILELLRDLPVSAGLAIRGDLRGVEEFYSLISGSEVRLERGFIVYRPHFSSYPGRIQVPQEHDCDGTLLNKTVSTGDNLWGIRWKKIPASLQCYALGDIKFGFITYNVLSGLLLRDLFPDPDVLCRYLDCTQIAAVNWFLEFVMLSLEGVEYHQGVEEDVQSREEMIQSP